MEIVTKQDQDQEMTPIPEDLPASDSDKEELRSALNRMMEAAGSWKRERAQLAAACDRLRRQLNDSWESVAASERGRSQLIAESDQLMQRISGTEEAAVAWDNERAHLMTECERLQQQIADTEQAAALALERQVRTAVERMRAELTTENERLGAELQRLTGQGSEWAAERKQLLAELEETKQLLADTEQAAALALERQISTTVGQVRTELKVEEDKLRQEIQKTQADRDQVQESLAKLKQQYARALDESQKLSATAQKA